MIVRTEIPKRVNRESSKTTNTRSMRHSIAPSLEGKSKSHPAVYSSEYNANNEEKKIKKSQWIHHVIVYGIKGGYYFHIAYSEAVGNV